MLSSRLYHEAVIHRRGRISGLGLDWTNQPTVYKSYDGLEHYSLPRQADLPEVSLWRAALGGEGGAALSMEALSAVLFHAAGLTRSSTVQGGEVFYRACPSAGALYPCEVYLAWPGGAGLAAGLYHYDVSRHGLTLLRSGYPDPASLGLPDASALPGEALLLVTAISFRSSWKYRARAYRYMNLDAGHLTEGLVLGLSAYGSSYRVELGFDDESITSFLGLDGSREGCLGVIRFSSGKAGEKPAPLEPLPGNLESFSRCAATDPLPVELTTIHEACCARFTRAGAMPAIEATRLGASLTWRDLSLPHGPAERLNFFAAASGRKSRRNFVASPVPIGTLGKVLSVLRGPLYPPGGHPAEDACAVGVLTGEEFQGQPGFSLLDRRRMRLGLRRDGNIRPVMAGVCLDQMWLREAALHVLFFVDFTEIGPGLGDRGYRAALQAAGRLGHRLYLAAEALGLGACGVGAFFDVEASEVLGLPEGSGLAYLVAVGTVRKA